MANPDPSPPNLKWSLSHLDVGVGGAAIGADSGPPGGSTFGSANPGADRVKYIDPSSHEDEAGVPKLWLFALDGTTISGTVWVLHEESQTWLQVSAATAVTPSLAVSVAVPRLTYARVFVGWSANTGVIHAGWRYST